MSDEDVRTVVGLEFESGTEDDQDVGTVVGLEMRVESGTEV